MRYDCKTCDTISEKVRILGWFGENGWISGIGRYIIGMLVEVRLSCWFGVKFLFSYQWMKFECFGPCIKRVCRSVEVEVSALRKFIGGF